MRILWVAAMVVAISGCGRKSFWDGDTYVLNPNRRDGHTCSVAGTLQASYPKTTVFDRDGKPVKCRWMTDEDDR